MARTEIQFICRSCGSIQLRWMGKCPECGQWDALEEYRLPSAGSEKDAQRGVAVAAGALANPVQAQPITAVEQDVPVARISTGITELDRVLGMTASSASATQFNSDSAGISNEVSSADSGVSAGFVPGSIVLLGGDPGIGKSTLLLQAANRLSHAGHRVLYVTSEESVQQIRLRARRLGAMAEQLYVLADTNLARIVEQIAKLKPALAIIDSIQMIYKGDLPAAPGSVTQLRTCCQELVYLAKSGHTAICLIGHVTKEGQLAGPRLLEHLVDTVLYFEGDRYHNHRLVRAVKNRFGTTLEIGIFEMGDSGLREVAQGAGLLASQYHSMAGSVVCPVLQGSRCLLVEIQALTATGFLGAAKRKVSGLDANRLAMLIAVLEKRGELRLADQDIFVSSVGGIKIVEPAADLALALAIAGAHLNKKLPPHVCAFGEIGLGGELRHVQMASQRITEAARLGFTHILCPPVPASTVAPHDCTLIPVRHLSNALEILE